MARTPALERPAALRALGVLLLALMLLGVWVTYAFFNKTFVTSEPLTITGTNAGLSLPKNADVKLRGQIVGELRSVERDGDGVRMEAAIQPEALKDIPAGVTAQIVPKTLFGEKFVSLVPPKNPTGQSIKAGATIAKATVPIEVETLLNDLYPLLEAVKPAELSNTLTAVSQALDGRGKELGDTLVQTNAYLKQINPELPQLVTDLDKLGQVSDVYAAALPDLGELLRNAVTTGDTVVAKRTQLATFLDEGTRLSDTLDDFVSTSGDDIEGLAKESRPVLEMTADYSDTFPCFLGAMDELVPRLDSVLREGTVHINLQVLGAQPTGYRTDESAVVTKKALSQPAAAPDDACHGLDDLASFQQEHSYPDPDGGPFSVPADVYKLVNVKESHKKFGTDADFNRAAAATSAGTESPQQRASMKELIGAQLGMEGSDVPDAATLLVGPVLRGAEVRVE